MPNSSKPKTKTAAKTDDELIWMFAHGIEEKHYTSVVMQSPNYVIFKIAGHKAWACVACPFQYVKAQYVLIRKGDWMMSDKPQRRWEGRVAKAMLKEAIRRSEILRQPYSGDFQAPICEECSVEMNYGEGYEGDKLVGYYRCDECGWSEDV
jgi:hypothetical protein